MKMNPLGLLAAAVGCVVLIGVLTFAGPCVHDDGTVATCHTAQVAIIGGAIFALAACLAGAFVKSPKVSGILFIAAAVAGVFIALAPGTLFDLCMMATMRCRSVMQPFAQFCGIALAAVALVAGVRDFRAGGSS